MTSFFYASPWAGRGHIGLSGQFYELHEKLYQTASARAVFSGSFVQGAEEGAENLRKNTIAKGENICYNYITDRYVMIRHGFL